MTDRPRHEIGQRIRTLREARGMTQGELARQIGSARSTLSVWENSERPVPVAQLRHIARVFGTQLADLVGEYDHGAILWSLDPLERELVQQFRELSPEAKEKFLQLTAYIIEMKDCIKHTRHLPKANGVVVTDPPKHIT